MYWAQVGLFYILLPSVINKSVTTQIILNLHIYCCVTSNRNLLRAFVENQQPTDNSTFKRHFISPSVAGGEIRGAKVFVSACCARSNGRLRATLPAAPKAFPANRQTVREQDREDRPRQRVKTVSVSAERQSLSPRSRQEPHSRTRAVLRSWLSHRRSKETKAGGRTSAIQSASLWSEALEACRMPRAAENPSRKKPTEGPLWSLNSL